MRMGDPNVRDVDSEQAIKMIFIVATSFHVHTKHRKERLGVSEMFQLISSFPSSSTNLAKY